MTPKNGILVLRCYRTEVTNKLLWYFPLDKLIFRPFEIVWKSNILNYL